MVANLPSGFRQKASAVVALAAATTLVGSVPAHAEGSRTTYIQAWTQGKESNRWYDGHRDSNATQVRFSSCATSGSGGFYANLVLYRAVDFAPDTSYGSRANQCNTSNWGTMSTAGNYYFKYTSDFVITVDTVQIYW